MDYNESDIKKIGLDQLSDVQIHEGVDAFNGFTQLFGKKWIEDHFHGAQIPAQVLFITELWMHWTYIKNLNKSDQIVKRWKSGITSEGVIQEVIVFGALSKIGVNLDLYPNIDGRISDAYFSINTENPVYIEISSRGLSDMMKDTLINLQKISNKAKSVIKGRHIKIGINRQIIQEELNLLLKWIETLNKNSKNPEYFMDFGIFHSTELETGGGDQKDLSVKFVSKPRMFTTSFRGDKGSLVEKATAVMHISDKNAQNLLQAEAKQLPKNECGVIILDISGVVDGLKIWEPLILKRFKPNINTRIAGVVLISMGNSNVGLKKNGIILTNPFAKKKLGTGSLKILKKLFH